MSVVAVTGGTGDLGKAVAERLAAQGDTAVIAGRDLDAAAGVAAELDAASAVRMDIVDAADCERAVAEVVERHGRIDGLVCCAATFAFVGALELDSEHLAEMMRVNVTGSLLPAQAAARAMISAGHGGSIVLFSSSAGQRAVGAPAYGASKAAVEALTRELGLAFAPHGIRVNCVSPGLIDSKMSEPAIGDPDTLAHFMNHTPLGRPGQPEEVAATTAYLLSDAAAYVTSTVVPTDGGFLSR